MKTRLFILPLFLLMFNLSHGQKSKQAAPNESKPTEFKTDGDIFFDSLMYKFRGNVVFVDFWATWCAPCRDGIDSMRPLKSELAGKKIVFVYITDNTSPEMEYNMMIPGIKGKHYRLTGEEWKLLNQKFQISSIPRFVLVNKNGEVIKSSLEIKDIDKLKKLLLAQLSN
jgi:thiol-disulfide isomerase/thioredoxin